MAPRGLAVAALALLSLIVAAHAELRVRRDWDITRAVLGVDVAHDLADHAMHPRALLLHTGSVDTRELVDVHARREADGFLTRLALRVFPRAATVVDAPTTYIVQFREPITDAVRTAVEAELGVRFGPYVPHHALLLHGTHELATRAAALPSVAFVGLHGPEHKVTGELREFLAAPAGARARGASGARSMVSSHVHGSKLFVLLSPAETGRTLDDAAVVAAALGALGPLADARAHVSVASADKLIVATTDGSDVPDALVAALAARPEVFLVELAPHFALRNKFARWLTQSGVQDQRPVFAAGITGTGQIVGCADSGLDWDNCLFSHDATSSVQPGASHRKVLRYEVMPGNDATDDVSGHGTHVVGSIVGSAIGSNAATISAWNGMAENAKVYFQDIGKTDGGLNVPADINAGLFPSSYEAGARIHSDSWGSSTPTYDSSAAEVDRFMAAHQDFLVLIAAGNDGAGADKITSTIGAPATSKNCLAVGASQTTNPGFVDSVSYVDWAARQKEGADAGYSDCCSAPKQVQEYCCQSAVAEAYRTSASTHREINVAPFSSRGPTADGRIKPELMAPGEYIVSAHSNGNGGNSYHCGTGSPAGANDAALLANAGTSMATPVMAGDAALVRQYFLEGWWATGAKGSGAAVTPSGALVKAVLINSGVPLTGQIDVGNNGTYVQLGEIPSIFQGFGRVQLDRTLKLAGSGFSLYFDDSASISTGEKINYCFTASGTDPIKATLVWTDPAGSPSADLALVNNLDLFMGTDATTVTGNWGNKKDVRNTVEQNSVTSVSPGTVYKVQISGRNVPAGPQRYALVVTGKFAASDKKTDCTYTFTDNFDDAGDKEAFPIGAAVGIGAAGAGAGLIGIVVAVFCRNNPTFGKILTQLLGGGGRQ